MLRIRSKRDVITPLVVILVAVGAVVALWLIFSKESTADSSTHSSDNSRPYSTSFKKAAIATNGKECADIGRNILLKGGKVADAAIAALLCEGVACFQSMGIGGGFLLTIYDKSSNKIETLNAREAAPLAAHKDMYQENPKWASKGGLAVAVPGELRGYDELYKRYGGGVPWKDLFEPTIKLCRTGITITNYTANILLKRQRDIYREPSLREIFYNPKTNRTWVAGDKMLRPKLADTLEIISNEGVEVFYDGRLTEDFLADIKSYNGIITKEDLKIYKAKWESPVEINLTSDLTMYGSQLPGAGPVMKIVFNILKNYIPKDLNSVITWQRIIETFKFTYGVRTKFGDPEFVPGIEELVANVTSPEFAEYIRGRILDDRTFNDEKHYDTDLVHVDDHGTAHLSFIAPNGDAISVTSTINLVLGAFFRSQSTGIILNDEMADFTKPEAVNAFGLKPSPANFIEPQKRPLSSMAPSIVIDKSGNVRLVIGAAGGMKITTTIILVTLRHLFFEQGIVDAVVAERLHHQLSPMKITMESGFKDELIEYLSTVGHQIDIQDPGDGFAALTAVAKEGDRFVPFSDIRRNGSVSGIN